MLYAIFPHTTATPHEAVRAIRDSGNDAATFGFVGLGARIESESIKTEPEAKALLGRRKIPALCAVFQDGKLTTRPIEGASEPAELPLPPPVFSPPPFKAAGDKSASAVSACDVLSVFFFNFPSWVDARGIRLGAFLSKRGISHDFLFTRHDRCEQDIAEAIERSGCKVFINELCVTRPEVIGALARRFPGVQFVSLNHGAPNLLVFQSDWQDRTFNQLLLSSREPNVFFGTVMPADRFDDVTGAKVVELPNFIDLPEVFVPPREDRPLSLSVVGRRDVVKGTPAAISTICRLARNRPDLSALIVSNGFDEADKAKLAHENVRASFVEWGDWRAMLDLVAGSVDIGLQYSLTESFNLVALEHLALGKPVVGTRAIEYLPRAWQINPQDPSEGARLVERLFGDLDKHAAKAREIAAKVSRSKNRTFVKNLESLLSR